MSENYYKYAPVIGGNGLKVKVGSYDEYKYFSVIPCLKGEEGKNAEKIFFLSPKLYPGYKQMMSTENGRNIIKNWEERKKLYENKENKPKINVSSVLIK